MAHLDDTTIALFVEHRLPDPQLTELKSHIDSCDSCRELVGQLARSDKALAEGSTLGAPARTRASDLLSPGERIGRYVVHELVGLGAMGAVYAAHDTDLDRRVAIKVLHGGAATSHARMLREAQALARVADRGVVAVHDVGTHGDSIYIAMEYITGGTFRTWFHAEPRTPRAIVTVALAAARGLVAAHDVGLVHRDVKPDNILVDAHGVARIGDFGLAAGVGERSDAVGGSGKFAAELTATGMLVGTPAYMAPEQLAGGAATQRSDQFSFAVTVYEALFGSRPFVGEALAELRRAMTVPVVIPDKPRVPAHVRKALVRALATDPEQRFPTMRALVQALDFEPRRRRMFLAIGGAAGVAALIGSVAIARSTVDTINPCQDSERKLAGVWDPARKAEIERAFLATELPYAADAWRGVERSIDQYTTSWAKMHRATCEATRVHGDQSEHVLELRMWCLDDRLHDARSLTDSLREATPKSVARAVIAADRLGTVDICADAPALAQKLPPRDAAARTKIDRVRAELANVKTAWNLGQLERSKTLAAEVGTAAREADYAPLDAEVLLEQARINFVVDGDAKAAEQTVERALWAADRGRDDYLRARAWNLLYYFVGPAQQRLDDAAKIYEHASAALERLVGADGLKAQLLGNHGQMLAIGAKLEEAAATLERSLALFEKTVGPDHIETGSALAALANVHLRTGLTSVSLGYAQRAYEVQARALGKKHPETAKSLFSVAIALEDLGKYDEAAARLTEVVATLEGALGKDHIDLATSVDELGVIRRKQNKLDDALALHQRALALRAGKLGDHNETSISLGNVGATLDLLKRHAEALPYHQRALAITGKVMGADHPETAMAHGLLASSYLGLGRASEALAELQRALAVTEQALGPEAFDLAFLLAGIGTAYLDLKKPAAAIAPLERALRIRGDKGEPMAHAEIQFALARALWATKRDRSRARKLAEQARPHYKAANQDEVERWLAAPR